jgi:hypothetical protein
MIGACPPYGKGNPLSNRCKVTSLISVMFREKLGHVFGGLDFMFPKSSSCQASVTGITVHNLMHWKFHHHANVIFLEHSSS